MPPSYNQAAVTARVAAVASVVDSGPSNGLLQLMGGANVLATFVLAKPSGAANGGVLTFLGTPIITTAIASGSITSGRITTSTGAPVVTNLSVGQPVSGADIIVATPDNSLNVVAGNNITLVAAELVGGAS